MSAVVILEFAQANIQDPGLASKKVGARVQALRATASQPGRQDPQAGAGPNTSTAFNPPKANELDIV